MPNTASASMTTVVTMGRLMAKSEMNMVLTQLLGAAGFPAPCSSSGVPGVIACAGPTSSRSPSFTPDEISIRSV